MLRTIGGMENNDRLPENVTVVATDPLVAARRRARIRLVPLVAIVCALGVTVGLNLFTGTDATEQAAVATVSGAPIENEGSVAAGSTAQEVENTTSTAASSGSTPDDEVTTGASTTAGTTEDTRYEAKDSNGSTTTRPGEQQSTAAANGDRRPSTTWSTTAEPALERKSFDGRSFGDGAVVGRDIAAGRYWTTNCAGWQHFDDEQLISRWSRHATQSMVDLRAGETLLSGCRWTAGNPPQANTLPTGKLSLLSQLTPGRYRPVNEFCMTGPTDTRSTDTISSENGWIAWESQPQSFELIVTGSENWVAYGLTSECGGLVRVG
jgi:hypothetical protein